jgi:hypothetical protein
MIEYARLTAQTFQTLLAKLGDEVDKQAAQPEKP